MNNAKPSDWKIEPLPGRQTAVPLNRLFSPEQMRLIRQGLIPQEMEDKWFIYWLDDALYFHRSWTGYCIYVVQFRREGESYRMVGAGVNRNPEQYAATDDASDGRMINQLIDGLLRQRPSI